MCAGIASTMGRLASWLMTASISSAHARVPRGQRVQVVELDGRLMELVQELRPRLLAFAREYHELDSFVMKHDLSSRQPEFLQVIDNPGGIRRVTFPLIRQRSHGPPGPRVQAEQRPRVVGRQTTSRQTLRPYRRRTNQHIEHGAPDSPGKCIGCHARFRHCVKHKPAKRPPRLILTRCLNT